MKNFGTILSFLLFLSVCFGCAKEKNSECNTMGQSVSAAAQIYAGNPTAQNCGIYKKAIQDYLNSSCANDLSQTDRQALQNALNNLGC